MFSSSLFPVCIEASLIASSHVLWTIDNFIRSTSNYHSDCDVGTHKHVFMFPQSSWCTYVIFNSCNNNIIVAVPLKAISLQPSFGIHSITQCMLDLCMYLRTYVHTFPPPDTHSYLADNMPIIWCLV